MTSGVGSNTSRDPDHDQAAVNGRWMDGWIPQNKKLAWNVTKYFKYSCGVPVFHLSISIFCYFKLPFCHILKVNTLFFHDIYLLQSLNALKVACYIQAANKKKKINRKKSLHLANIYDVFAPLDHYSLFKPGLIYSAYHSATVGCTGGGQILFCGSFLLQYAVVCIAVVIRNSRPWLFITSNLKTNVKLKCSQIILNVSFTKA